ncbi:putative intracellular protease/amidase [Chitinophaga niastensis]|uniref:Putative intracellular protease/amidase n=1 Tax=Chitinophaga niastensis TaxID=536980 RepID=A0A2P8HU28_CHINA|nr:DJ-1/PfpI family protein [Chitinophaga niastensis]PSL49739.1 putative intracellular protease/amidase [Chitinophaga niastensis]
MKTLRNCYVFLFNEYSDWEPALTMYGLGCFTDINVVTFSLNGQPVTSGGKVPVQPQASLAQAMTADIDLLILPGGAPMEQGGNTEVLPLVKQLLAQNKTVAAICGATALLAQHGFLDQISHTSNHPEVLKMLAPAYKGAAFYKSAPAVAADNIITASGTAMVDFAQAIYTHFNLLENEKLNFWFQFFPAAGAGTEMQTVLPLHFFYRRYQTNFAGMLPLVRTAIKEIYQQAIGLDLEICGGAQWHYINFDGNPETVFTLDIGLPVTAVKAVPAPYHCETLPGFKCVSMQHNGSWDQLADTYTKLITGIQMLGIQMNGHTREQYLRYDFEQPSQNITNVQIGVA